MFCILHKINNFFLIENSCYNIAIIISQIDLIDFKFAVGLA